MKEASTPVFPYRTAEASIALKLDGYYVWDCAVIEQPSEVGRYHMFSSRWKSELGFGANWLLNSEIIHSVADRPEGPYRYYRTVLSRRGREFFDGMNTHNTCIRAHNGKFYLYYMGTTYEGDASEQTFVNVWNRKRIGVAVADSITAPFVRMNEPLLLPRSEEFWDQTATTNPAVTIAENDEARMIYKSRRADNAPLMLGICSAPSPLGPFTRMQDEPILSFDDENLHVEDPFLWFDASKNRYCMIAKDDCKNGSSGLTGEWGNGFYAESEDCLHFSFSPTPVYTRTVTWADGRITKQCNLERPWLLFDENGTPTHLFCASGAGSRPYDFEGETYIVSIRLQPS